jgi:e3 binding domain.
VDLDKVVGTGKDGRIKKSDIEAVIADQDLA